ncbi:MAG TPA: hypothetical protein VF702_02250 [Allosphingosinicella sp.]|jgi:hypothetical protein
MKKSATDVMQDILFAATIDGIMALKAASKGLPNTLLRDLNAIHANTTLPDLPPELQAAISAGVRTAFAMLLREGYSVAPGTSGPPRPPRPQGGPGGAGGGRGPGGGERRPHGRPGPRREGGGPGGGGRPAGPKRPR